MNHSYKSVGYTGWMPRNFMVDELLIKLCVVVSTGRVAVNLIRHVWGVELLLRVFLAWLLDGVSV
jgi:hypothetical protein